MDRVTANRRRVANVQELEDRERSAIRELLNPVAPTSPATPGTVPKYIQNRYGQNVLNTHKTPVCEI
jgi:hypothetical protein